MRGAKTLTMTTMLAMASMMSTVMAHSDKIPADQLCNPVVDGSSSAVRTSDGDVLLHGGTYACPPEEEVVEEVVIVEEPVVIVIDGDVAFDFDEATIKPEFQGELDEIAAILEEAPESRVTVTGHTDSIGDEAYNQGLSERRAQAAADYLVAAGLESTRFVVDGQGETQPIASNDTKEGRAQNRRVAIESLID